MHPMSDGSPVDIYLDIDGVLLANDAQPFIVQGNSNLSEIPFRLLGSAS